MRSNTPEVTNANTTKPINLMIGFEYLSQKRRLSDANVKMDCYQIYDPSFIDPSLVKLIFFEAKESPPI